MRVKRLPNVLALHLKRFKYVEHLQRFKKLSYRIAFPLELKLTNTAETAAEPDRKYSLFAVVVHVGAGPSHGHYICLVRSHKHWLLFDDDTVDLVEEGSLQSCFGSALESAGSTETGYILFYQARPLEIARGRPRPLEITRDHTRSRLHLLILRCAGRRRLERRAVRGGRGLTLRRSLACHVARAEEYLVALEPLLHTALARGVDSGFRIARRA